MFRVRYLTRQAYIDAARELNVDVAVIMAVAKVESAGDGFIKGSDLPKMLFEGHWFHGFTEGRFDADYPSISYPTWTKAHYKGGRGEYDRLLTAIRINNGNPQPALLSSSWGRFQIMGFNYDKAGYSNVEDFVNAMSSDENAHLRAFVSFIRTTGLDDELQKLEWANFARQYNGKGYEKNAYHIKMASEFAACRKRLEAEREGGHITPERQNVIELQTTLNIVLGDSLPERLAVDGWLGENTLRAIQQYCRQEGLPVPKDAKIDASVYRSIGLLAWISWLPKKKAPHDGAPVPHTHRDPSGLRIPAHAGDEDCRSESREYRTGSRIDGCGDRRGPELDET
ncbi:MAG: hypothetical protein CMI67_24490 [Pelagibaca sp.]|nr:hypothetical protein [Pelagibaca sp.]